MVLGGRSLEIIYPKRSVEILSGGDEIGRRKHDMEKVWRGRRFMVVRNLPGSTREAYVITHNQVGEALNDFFLLHAY
jgi:hypothetical protein